MFRAKTKVHAFCVATSWSLLGMARVIVVCVFKALCMYFLCSRHCSKHDAGQGVQRQEQARRTVLHPRTQTGRDGLYPRPPHPQGVSASNKLTCASNEQKPSHLFSAAVFNLEVPDLICHRCAMAPQAMLKIIINCYFACWINSSRKKSYYLKGTVN